MKRNICILIAILFCLFSLSGCKDNHNTPDPNASTLDDGQKVTDFYIGTPDKESQENKEAPIEESTVSFLAVGDNIMYSCNFTDAKNRANEEYPEYNFTPIYEDLIPQIKQADLAYINQETVMAGEKYGYQDYPCFNTPQHLGEQLIDIGFDIINIATNHMLDMGSNGLEDTIDYWNSKKEITMIGGYENEEAYLEPCIIEKNDITMAFLSYTYSTNGISPSASSQAVIPYIDSEAIRKDIQRVHDLADTVIVSIHWGIENSLIPSSEQQELAQMMCDEGVDVIIGTHPHVIQPVEWINSDNGNQTLCIYSLGNFVAVMTSPANMLGGMMTFDIVKNGDEISIEAPLFTPVVHHFGPSYYNSKLYYLCDYTDELAAQLGRDCYGIRTSYDGLCNIATDVISPEFLPDYLKTSEEQQ